MRVRARHRGRTRPVVTTAVLTGIAALALTGCGDDHTVVVVSPPDDGIVATDLSAAGLEGAATIDLREELRIASTSFSYVRGVSITPAGDIVVLDQQSAEVRVFDETGTQVLQFGGAGDGPGELLSPSAMDIAGDTLFIIDRRGINRFLTDGTYIDRATVGVRPGPRGGIPYPQTIDHTPRGLVLSFHVLNGPRPSNPFSDSLVLHVMDGATGDVGEPLTYLVSDHTYRLASGSEGRPLFMNRLEFDVAGDGRLFVTRADGNLIDILSPDGSPTGRIRFDAPRERVTEREVDQILAEVAARMETVFASGQVEGGPTAAEYISELEAMPRAQFKPVVGTLLAGSDGRLLVERMDLNGGTPVSPAETVWDLLSATGTIVGRMQFPPRFTPRVVHGDFVTGVQLDDTDVPSVVQYRMVSAGQ